MITQFNDCFLQLALFDLGYQGPMFTWSNSQPLMPIAKKLDRLLVNNFTITVAPHVTTNFLPPLMSDHCPCLIDLNQSMSKAGTKPFSFLNYLIKHLNFTSEVS